MTTMLDTIISILIIVVACAGAWKLNLMTKPDYVKNYSFKRDFVKDNKKLVFWFCFASVFILILILLN